MRIARKGHGYLSRSPLDVVGAPFLVFLSQFSFGGHPSQKVAGLVTADVAKLHGVQPCYSSVCFDQASLQNRPGSRFTLLDQSPHGLHVYMPLILEVIESKQLIQGERLSFTVLPVNEGGES